MDPQAEVERLVALGAAVVEQRPDLVAMTDPDGNELCLLTGWSRRRGAGARDL